LSAKLVPTFADKRYYVVSVADPYGCILGFLDRTPLITLYKIICFQPTSDTARRVAA
jgi:hypothetical protein